MTVETLKGLELVQSLSQPIPDSVVNFYKNTYATGTGPYGVLTIQDFLGFGEGYNVINQMQLVNSTLATMTLTTLASAYSNMLSTVQGAFGPMSGPIVIPSGPGAGTYTDGDDAFVNGLIPATNTIISALAVSYPTQVASLNNNFNSICQQIVTEAANQAKTGIKFNELTGNDTASIMGFVSGLSQVGSFKTPGGPLAFITNVTDQTNQTGQAIIGAVREGSNQLSLNEAGIPVESFTVSSGYPGDPTGTGVDTLSGPGNPQQPGIAPGSPQYQSTSNPTSTDYTVAEAVAINNGTVSTAVSAPVVKIQGIYNQVDGAPGTAITTLIQSQPFYIKVQVSPSSASTVGYISTSVASVGITYTNYSNSPDGVFIAAPGWLVDTIGTQTLTISANEVGGPTGADSVTVSVAATNYVRSTEIVQDGFFASVNTTKAGSTVTVTIKGTPSTAFTWTQDFISSWPKGSFTLDGSGTYTASNLPAPPVGTYKVTVTYSTGSPTYTNFTVVPA